MSCNSIILGFGSTAEEACINQFLDTLYINTFWIDGTDLSDSTVIYSESGCTIPASLGYYSDGTNVAQWTEPSDFVFVLTGLTTCNYSSTIQNCCDPGGETLDFVNITTFYTGGTLPVGLTIRMTGEENSSGYVNDQCYTVVSGTSASTFSGVSFVSYYGYSGCSTCLTDTICYLKSGKYQFTNCNDYSDTKIFEITNSYVFDYNTYVIYSGICYSPNALVSSGSTAVHTYSVPDGTNCGSDPGCQPTPTPTPSVSIYFQGCCDNVIYESISGITKNVGNVLRDGSGNGYIVIPSYPTPPSPTLIDNSTFSDLGTALGCLNPEVIQCVTPTQTISLTLTPTPTIPLTSTPTPTPTINNCDKGIMVNFGESPYTDCNILTGTTIDSVTGVTSYTNITGGTINLILTDCSLPQIYIKIVCSGCESETYLIDLIPCTPTPTPSISSSVTPTLTPTPTPTPAPTCYCTTVTLLNSDFILTDGGNMYLNYIACDGTPTLGAWTHADFPLTTNTVKLCVQSVTSNVWMVNDSITMDAPNGSTYVVSSTLCSTSTDC